MWELTENFTNTLRLKFEENFHNLFEDSVFC